MNKVESFSIGVDIGGTKIAFALVDSNGHIIAADRVPTHREQGADAVIRRVIAGIEHLQQVAAGRHIEGVGVGCPGHVDADGTVRYATIMNWKNVSLRAQLMEHLNMHVIVENDVRALATGEMRFGAARGRDHFVYVALGTGLGCAAVVDGRLLHGATGFAMEVGQIERPDGFYTNSQISYLQDAASGGAVGQLLARRRPFHRHTCLTSHATPAKVIQAAETGDPLALQILDEIGTWVGYSVLWMSTILEPELIVLGGGFGHAAQMFLIPAIGDMLHRHAAPPVHASLQVNTSTLSDSAIGAAALVLGKTASA